MQCSRCKERAVYARNSSDGKRSPSKTTAKRQIALCKAHFILDFEKRVWDSVARFTMILPGEKVAVAVSGGKDSMSLLHILNKEHAKKRYALTAICVDEGIAGYRETTLTHLKTFCTAHNIPLKVVSFKGATGKTLDEHLGQAGRNTRRAPPRPKSASLPIASALHPCTVCGKYRREILNAAAKGSDKLATGHNLDDEAQTVLMNLCTNKAELLTHQRPVSPASEGSAGKGFIPRIKPFCLIPEKDVMLYAVLNKLQPPFVECPYMHEAFRDGMRDALNAYEAAHPGTKKNIYEAHLATQDARTGRQGRCSSL